MKPRGILLDIEGTTTPIAFVYDVLFPFARKRLEQACANPSHPEIKKALDLLREEWSAEPDSVREEVGEFGNGSAYTAHLMDRDRKSTGLKKLQGILWEEGYRSGELKGEVFEDVPRAFHRWTEQGIRIRIYSSGSILAQKLLFGHSNHGDLTVHLEDYHDTTTGPKKDSESYARIAEAFELPPSEILFLSDNLDELGAASRAGMQTALAVRPGNPPLTDPPFRTVRDFDSVLP